MSVDISRRAVAGGLAASFIDLRLAQAQPAAPSPSRTIEARAGEIALGDAKTAAFTYDGSVPGPLLRAKAGEDFRLRFVNKLDQPTTLHWHGLRGVNAMDGIGGLTQKPVAPGATFDVAFKAADPGFLLYRPATLPYSPEQIARGMAGVLIVDEPQPPDVDTEHLLLFQDWSLDAKGAVTGPFETTSLEGRSGMLLTAGGKPVPFAATAPSGGRVRLRIANAAGARIMIIAFTGARPKIIGIDGQPCDPFEPVRLTVPIGPGARFDLLMDMPNAENSEVKLLLRDPVGGTPDRDLAIWTTSGAAAKTRAAIAALPLNPLLPGEIKLGNAKKLELTLEPPKSGVKGARWLVNGAPRSYADKPLFAVPRGTPVSLGFTNKSSTAVPICVHGVAVRLLHDLDDGWEPYWRNGVIVPGGKSKHVAFVADAPGKWALRSDNVDQEAQGLATWFEVT